MYRQIDLPKWGIESKRANYKLCIASYIIQVNVVHAAYMDSYYDCDNVVML